MPDENQPEKDQRPAESAPASDTSNPASSAPDVTAPTPPPSEFEKQPDPPAPAPELNADGTPKRKRGRPRKDEARPVDPLSVTPNPRPRQSVPPIAQPSAIAVDYDALGKMAANAWFGAGVVIFGREWEPNMSDGEHVAVKDAFRDYFQAKQIQRIDPGVQLAIVLGSYSLVRVQRPTIKDRLAKAWAWTKNRLRREP